jgi:hypothetical protein
MPTLTLTLDYQTDAQRMALEQAVAYVQQLHHAADTAAHGTVLAVCEQLALTDGRQLLRDSLAAALQDRADATDAKKKPPTPDPKGGTPAGC